MTEEKVSKGAGGVSATGPEEGAVRARSKDGEQNLAAHGLRGLAALMVVFAHIIGGPARHVYADDAVYVAAVKAPWYIATFGVQMFFVISGYVILPSALRYTAKEFALRRTLRLYPLFGVLTLLFVVLNAWTDAYPKLNTPIAVVSGFLFLNLFTGTDQLTPNAWSLTFEVIFYALTCAVVTFAVKRRDLLLSAIAIGAAVSFFVAFPISIYFLIGAGIRVLRWRYPHGGSRLRGVEVAAFVTMMILASSGHYEYWWRDFLNPAVVPLIASTAVFFYCALAPDSLSTRVLGNKVAAYLGTISYSLYLVHPYIYLALRKLFVRHDLFTSNLLVSMVPFAVAVLVCSLVASHVIHLGLERWPYERFFRQRMYRLDRIGRSATVVESTVAGQRA